MSLNICIHICMNADICVCCMHVDMLVLRSDMDVYVCICICMYVCNQICLGVFMHIFL